MGPSRHFVCALFQYHAVISIIHHSRCVIVGASSAVYSQTTVQWACEYVRKKADLPHDDSFGLVQFAIDGSMSPLPMLYASALLLLTPIPICLIAAAEFISERPLAGDERLLDVVSSWYDKRKIYMKQRPKSDLK